MTVRTNSLANIIQKKLDVSTYREQHWEGTLWDYLDLVQQDPAVARNAFQRVYDMIQSFGVETVTQFKQEYKRYKFFSDPIGEGADAIYGLESKLVTLVDFFKSNFPAIVFLLTLIKLSAKSINLKSRISNHQLRKASLLIRRSLC